MANNTELNLGSGGDTIATEDISGVKHELVKVEFGADGIATKVSSTDPLPVTDDAAETSLDSIDTKLSSQATAAKQDTGNSLLSSIDSKLGSPLTVTGTVSTGLNPLTDAQLRASAVPVSGTITATPTGTQNVDVTANTIGLATSTKQDTGNTSLSTIAGKDFATQTTLASVLAKIIAAPATEAKQDTGNTSLASIDTKLTNPLPVSAASLPLPSLAATSTKQSDGSQKTQVVDGSGNVIGATSNALDVNIKSGNPSTITVTQATGTNLHTVVDSGTITAVTAISNALPAGNNNIGDVDVATIPALVAGSAIIGKVGIDQTTPGTTNGVQVNAALPAGSNVIGHVIADSGSTTAVTGNVTVIQGTASNLKTAATLDAETTKVIGTVNIASAQTLATVTAVTAITNALPAGTNLLGITQSKDLPDSSSTYALTNVSSTAYEASHVLKNGAGYLFMVTGYNSKTSAQFIQLHNSTTVPGDTAVPVLIFTVPASSNFSLDLGKYGRYFSIGIAICNSSTGPTKTVGSGDCWFDAQVI